MEALSSMTIGELFDAVACRFPDREALVDIPRGKRYSYRELQRIVNRLATGLLKLGIATGEHLAIWMPNRSEYIIAELAAAMIGAVPVSVDTNAQPQQLAYLLRPVRFPNPHPCRRDQGRGHYRKRFADSARRSITEAGRMQCRALPELRRLIAIADQRLPGCSPGMMFWGREAAFPTFLLGRAAAVMP